MINKIQENIFQLHFREFGSCVYVIKLENKIILIDTSTKENKEELLKDLKELNIEPKQVDLVLITHTHFDHIANMDLFENAKIYSEENANEIENEILELKIIQTPGHKEDCVCFLYKEVLFSGDILFHDGIIGRTDFPGGDPKEMEDSLDKLSKISYEILCPGHISKKNYYKNN